MTNLLATTYPEHDLTQWIISRRPARAHVNAFEPHGFFLEKERSLDGTIVDCAGVLLTNKECPWHCLMCDLWKHTLTTRVPVGAIPAQIEFALARVDTQPQQVKLYNSGSFFDTAAIPPEDYAGIAERVSFAKNVVVESHPRLVGKRALEFRELLAGSLEVAMGLETVHPDVLPRLNKRFTLEQFSDAATWLRKQGMAVRAFVLVRPPFIAEDEAVKWAVESARFAFSCGAGVVSLIPTRAGNGALDQLAQSGEFAPPRLSTLEQSHEAALSLRAGRVFADTWDLERFSVCAACFQERRRRIEMMNLTQDIFPRIRCASCASP